MHIIKNNFKPFTFVCILIANITSCSTVTPPATPKSSTSWNTRRTTISRLNNWQLSGKIAVITNEDSGSASIEWSQRAKNYNISLYGPIGTSGIKLTGRPGKVTMKTGSGREFSARTPEQLLSQQLGWNLPVSALKYWIRGIPIPGAAQKSSFDTSHRLRTLVQKGYKIKYQRYTSVNGVDLPQRLNITAKSLKTKIIIYKWQIPH